jgi:hypothetical protein
MLPQAILIFRNHIRAGKFVILSVHVALCLLLCLAILNNLELRWLLEGHFPETHFPGTMRLSRAGRFESKNSLQRAVLPTLFGADTSVQKPMMIADERPGAVD